jgi:hypothetical protein
MGKLLWRLGCAAVALLGLVCAAPGADMIRTGSRFYTIYTDLPKDEAREIAKHMDGVFGEYTRRLSGAGFSATVRMELPLYLFSTQSAYVNFLAQNGINGQNSAGMFFVMPKVQGLAAWTGDQSRMQMLHTLQHEGFHQFAFLRIGGALPIWANEGLAEYFGDALLVRGRFVTGLVDPSRLAFVKAAIKADKAIPFNAMIGMSSRQWSFNVASGSPIGHLQYAQAWSMVHFLVHAKPAYQQAFMRYLQQIKLGRPSEAAFEKAFGSTDYEPFEEAWREYILALEPDELTTAAERLTFLAQGLKMLAAKQKTVDSIESLKTQLQEVNFRIQRRSHIAVQEFKASDASLFEAPQDPKSRRKSTIKLVANRDAKLPPEIHVSGLRTRVRLAWELDEEGRPVEQIVFQ